MPDQCTPTQPIVIRTPAQIHESLTQLHNRLQEDFIKDLPITSTVYEDHELEALKRLAKLVQDEDQKEEEGGQILQNPQNPEDVSSSFQSSEHLNLSSKTEEAKKKEDSEGFKEDSEVELKTIPSKQSIKKLYSERRSIARRIQTFLKKKHVADLDGETVTSSSDEEADDESMTEDSDDGSDSEEACMESEEMTMPDQCTPTQPIVIRTPAQIHESLTQLHNRLQEDFIKDLPITSTVYEDHELEALKRLAKLVQDEDQKGEEADDESTTEDSEETRLESQEMTSKPQEAMKTDSEEAEKLFRPDQKRGHEEEQDEEKEMVVETKKTKGIINEQFEWDF